MIKCDATCELKASRDFFSTFFTRIGQTQSLACRLSTIYS